MAAGLTGAGTAKPAGHHYWGMKLTTVFCAHPPLRGATFDFQGMWHTDQGALDHIQSAIAHDLGLGLLDDSHSFETPVARYTVFLCRGGLVALYRISIVQVGVDWKHQHTGDPALREYMLSKGWFI